MFDWREFLNFATICKKIGEKGMNKEAAFRSAISRSYYAAFNAAKNVGISMGYANNSAMQEDSHKHLITELSKNDRPSYIKNIAFKLQRLRASRVKADYDEKAFDGSTNIVKQVDSSIITATSLFEDLDNGEKPTVV